MNENYTNQNIPQGDEGQIDIMEYVKKLLKNWKFCLKWGCYSALVALILVIDLPKKFDSTATLAPEIVQKTGLSSSMSSLASLAGVNLTNLGPTMDAMYPDLYPKIINSDPFLVELFSMPVAVPQFRDEPVQTDLYTYYYEYLDGPWWGVIANFVLNAPLKALFWVKDQIKALITGEEEIEEGGYHNINPLKLTKEQEKILEAIRESISVSVDKKTGVITISARTQNAVISKQMCDKIVENLLTYVVRYRTEKARKDVAYYEGLVQEARDNYYAIQKKYAEYVDANHGLTRQSIRIEQERLQNETNLAFTLYNQVCQQLQMAEAKVQQETPVFTVVSPAVVANIGNPSRFKSLIILTFLFCCVGAAWVLFGNKAMEILADLKK